MGSQELIPPQEKKIKEMKVKSLQPTREIWGNRKTLVEVKKKYE